MHSHIPAIGSNLVNSYTTRALERGDATHRPVDVRKKLVGTSPEIAVEADREDDWMVGRGYEEASKKGTRRPAPVGTEGADTSETGEFVESLSVWA